MEQTVNYKGHTIKIKYDEFAENPQTAYDQFGEVVLFGRLRHTGNKHNFVGPEDFREFIKEEHQNAVVLPVFAYSHGGTTINTSGFGCSWDSGQVGYIYTTIERLKYFGHNWKRWSDKRRAQAKEWLKSEIELLDSWLKGNVYGYVIEKDGEEVESCWGYIGDDENGEPYALQEAKSCVDHLVTYNLKKHIKNRKAQIRANVPLQYRKPFAA